MKLFERPFSFTKKKEFITLSDNKVKLLFLPSIPNQPLWVEGKRFSSIKFDVEFPTENTDGL